jgi:hypothetical protein
MIRVEGVFRRTLDTNLGGFQVTFYDLTVRGVQILRFAAMLPMFFKLLKLAEFAVVLGMKKARPVRRAVDFQMSMR